jgi:glycosyltransferase involved in cell wall biosynthesis
MTSDPRLRILYVINDLALGGAQRVLLAQASGLDRARFAPEVASLELMPGGEIAAELEASGIPIHRLRGERETPLAALRLFGLVRRVAPDLVHTHLAAAGVVGRLAARWAGTKRVASTLHNLSDWEERRGHPLRRLERGTLGIADHVVAVSDAVRRAFCDACPRLADRAITVRNGITVGRFAHTPAETARAREGLGYSPRHFVVGAVARLDPRKGLDTLIEAVALAAADHPSVRLLIVGDGPERARLERQARERGVAPLVQWVGFRAEVRPFFAAMDLFAAPSRSEGLGVSIIEALASGVPALGANVGGIPEVLGGSRAGLLLPVGDAPAWGRTIAQLVEDRATLAMMAAAASGEARAFSSAAAVEALEDLYQPAPPEIWEQAA